MDFVRGLLNQFFEHEQKKDSGTEPYSRMVEPLLKSIISVKLETRDKMGKTDLDVRFFFCFAKK